MIYRTNVFVIDGDKAIRLPKECMVEPGDVIVIEPGPTSNSFTISKKPDSWHAFFELADATKVPADFMDERDN